MSEIFVIYCHQLFKNYGPIQALQGVDLAVQPGEIFGFLGPNGAGKTTTIRILLDLIRPSSGMVRVLNLDPQKYSVAVRSRCGYLPGELRLESTDTVETIFRQYNALRGGKTSWETVQSLVQRLDLDLKTHAKNLSKGNKQKVGVILALMHKPELLLLDEPTSGLDPLMQQEVLKLISEARNDGATVFFSSHNIKEVEQIADRVGLIRKGKVIEVAETQALIQRALRRARIRLAPGETFPEIDNFPGVMMLEQKSGVVQLQVEGDMDALIKTLSKVHVMEFETERPTLEEVFLAYYER